jgi:hypothetical protein
MPPRILDGLNEQSCFYNPLADSTRKCPSVPAQSHTQANPSFYSSYSGFDSKAPSQLTMAPSQNLDHAGQDPYHTWPHSPLHITDFNSQWAYFQPQNNQSLGFDAVPSIGEDLFGLDSRRMTSNASPSHFSYTYETVASLLPTSMQGNAMDYSANPEGLLLHHPFDDATAQAPRTAPPTLLDHTQSHAQNPFSRVTNSAAPNRTQDAATSTRKSKSRPQKACTNCGVTTTPMWRRNPSTHELLCNACGIYLQTRNKRRPLELCSGSASSDDGSDDAASHLDDAAAETSQEDWKGRVCDHCATKVTSVWRRSGDGRQLCNACGVYVRMKGKERPLHLRSNKVKPRFKHI